MIIETCSYIIDHPEAPDLALGQDKVLITGAGLKLLLIT